MTHAAGTPWYDCTQIFHCVASSMDLGRRPFPPSVPFAPYVAASAPELGYTNGLRRGQFDILNAPVDPTIVRKWVHAGCNVGKAWLTQLNIAMLADRYPYQAILVVVGHRGDCAPGGSFAPTTIGRIFRRLGWTPSLIRVVEASKERTASDQRPDQRYAFRIEQGIDARRVRVLVATRETVAQVDESKAWFQHLFASGRIGAIVVDEPPGADTHLDRFLLQCPVETWSYTAFGKGTGCTTRPNNRHGPAITFARAVAEGSFVPPVAVRLWVVGPDVDTWATQYVGPLVRLHQQYRRNTSGIFLVLCGTRAMMRAVSAALGGAPMADGTVSGARLRTLVDGLGHDPNVGDVLVTCQVCNSVYHPDANHIVIINTPGVPGAAVGRTGRIGADTQRMGRANRSTGPGATVTFVVADVAAAQAQHRYLVEEPAIVVPGTVQVHVGGLPEATPAGVAAWQAEAAAAKAAAKAAAQAAAAASVLPVVSPSCPLCTVHVVRVVAPYGVWVRVVTGPGPRARIAAVTAVTAAADQQYTWIRQADAGLFVSTAKHFRALVTGHGGTARDGPADTAFRAVLVDQMGAAAAATATADECLDRDGRALANYDTTTALVRAVVMHVVQPFMLGPGLHDQAHVRPFWGRVLAWHQILETAAAAAAAAAAATPDHEEGPQQGTLALLVPRTACPWPTVGTHWTVRPTTPSV